MSSSDVGVVTELEDGAFRVSIESDEGQELQLLAERVDDLREAIQLAEAEECEYGVNCRFLPKTPMVEIKPLILDGEQFAQMDQWVQEQIAKAFGVPVDEIKRRGLGRP